MYGDYVREVDARGTTVWEWHAQDDLDIERYPLHPLVHRDEFAHANACCPLPNGDVMLSFPRLSIPSAPVVALRGKARRD